MLNSTSPPHCVICARWLSGALAVKAISVLVRSKWNYIILEVESCDHFGSRVMCFWVMFQEIWVVCNSRLLLFRSFLTYIFVPLTFYFIVGGAIWTVVFSLHLVINVGFVKVSRVISAKLESQFFKRMIGNVRKEHTFILCRIMFLGNSFVHFAVLLFTFRLIS